MVDAQGLGSKTTEKNRNKIKIKVPHINITREQSSEPENVKPPLKPAPKQSSDKEKSIIRLKPPGYKSNGKKNPGKLFSFWKKKPVDDVTFSNEDIIKAIGTERESLDIDYSENFIHRLSISKKSKFTQYSYKTHGSLVEVALTPQFEVLRQYWVDPGRALVYIAYNKGNRMKEYLLFEPALTKFEIELLERLHEDLRDVLILTDEELGIEREHLLISKTEELIHYYGVSITRLSLFKIQYYLSRNYLGWGRINALMQDPNIEDISCDGDNIPIFLFHRKEQNIKTNIQFDQDALISLAITLAQRSGKHISSGSPLIDATIPDGSRLQLTFGTEVTTRGTSFTIRKFREQPFTPIDLMELKTFSPEMLVYFWLSIENNMSIVFIGGTASGKTTSLNAVSLFMPPLSKVISIEDTRELTLFHDNWIASVTRDSISEGGTTIDMFTLLKAAMRQRPEYILVGEVRGHEAQTLFQAMNTGHTTFSTMHAGSVDAAIHRLENEPLNVPRNMLQALNVLSIQKQIQIGPDRSRRCEEIVEIAGIDPATGNIMVNTVFEYEPIADTYRYSGRSQVLGEIATMRGWSKEALLDEMDLRRRLLESLQVQDIRDYIRFSKVVQTFYIDRQHIIDNLSDLARILE